MRVVILGVENLKGPGDNNPFNFVQVGYAVPVELVNNPKIQIHGFGVKVPTDKTKKPLYMAATPESIAKFATLPLPCLCDVTLSGELNSRGVIEQVLTDIKEVPRPVAVKAA